MRTRRAEAVAETVALAWQWFIRLAERGKDARPFASVLASLAARSVHSGRRLCGMEKATDVLSPVAQRRHGFQVEALPLSTRTDPESLWARAPGQRLQEVFEERLCDNRQTPVPEQVAFRLDWPRFFSTLSERDRRLAEFLSLGHSAQQAARTFGVCPSRVTQLRRRWCRDWRAFQEATPLGG